MAEISEKSLLLHALKKWMPRLTTEEKWSIREYTGIQKYTLINTILREDRYEEATTDIQKPIDNIDKALRKFKYEKSFTVYRTVSEQEYDFILSHNEIEAFADFKSTSIAQEVTEKLTQSPMKHIVVAKLPAMVNGAYIAPLSVFAGEKEFLLNRGCKYQVISNFHDIEKDIKYILLEVVI
ncbi:ADP-ribosyltransferase [Salinicoccus hispanicus]|uniref:ADP ribosyltransferase domain-containing protein n=1 Tax=Salinicoccus hispanicus TaxID=157225 RepID=A0A6N8U2S9_9STAP|nr:ADP-ribosyltransferase [Salinicoccus hispanicus]MXQ51306.1 hypothetical protein [Salinicoccus hispanicus]